MVVVVVGTVVVVAGTVVVVAGTVVVVAGMLVVVVLVVATVVVGAIVVRSVSPVVSVDDVEQAAASKANPTMNAKSRLTLLPIAS
jgi:hypothetical protein